MFVTPPSVMGLIKDGRVRAARLHRHQAVSADFPDVPLMKDMLPGYQPTGSWGIFCAPGKTPDDIVDKLNGEIRKALQVPAVADIMQRDGYIPDDRDRRRDGCVLPQRGHAGRRGGEGCGDRAELIAARIPARLAPVILGSSFPTALSGLPAAVAGLALINTKAMTQSSVPRLTQL